MPRPADIGTPQPGDAVGPWRLLRELGAGGMGSVWLAERADGQLKRQVALKLPRLRAREFFPAPVLPFGMRLAYSGL
jgi:serine/threonine protein kinase